MSKKQIAKTVALRSARNIVMIVGIVAIACVVEDYVKTRNADWQVTQVVRS